MDHAVCWETLAVRPKKDEQEMSVAGLIEILRTYPQDLPVLVEGYEGGWDKIHSFRKKKVVSYDGEWWYGEYFEPSEAKKVRSASEHWLIKSAHSQIEVAGKDPKTALLIVGRRGGRRR